MCTQFGKNPILCNKFLSTLQAGRLFSLQCTFVPFYCFPQTKIRYTFQHYQHGPRRLIEERNELGEGPLKKMQRLSLHTAGQLNVLRISVHRTSLMCDKLELVSTALLPRRGGRRNRNLLMPKVSWIETNNGHTWPQSEKEDGSGDGSSTVSFVCSHRDFITFAESLMMATKNYVAELNEYAQRNRLKLKYEYLGSDGPDHNKVWVHL